jgi:hypothetical protein
VSGKNLAGLSWVHIVAAGSLGAPCGEVLRRLPSELSEVMLPAAGRPWLLGTLASPGCIGGALSGSWWIVEGVGAGGPRRGPVVYKRR